MLKITNGLVTTVVTNGAYESIFKQIGYTIVQDEVKKEPEMVSKSIEKSFEEEIVEKPLSEWTKAEVKRFADAKKINLAGVKSVNEVKQIIKKYIESHS